MEVEGQASPNPPLPPALYTALPAANAQRLSFPAALATVATPAATIKATAGLDGPPPPTTKLPGKRGPPLVLHDRQHDGAQQGSPPPSQGARLRGMGRRVLQGLGPCMGGSSQATSSATRDQQPPYEYGTQAEAVTVKSIKLSGSKGEGGAQSWVVHAAGLAVGAEAGRVRLSPLECATMLHTINPKALVLRGDLHGPTLRRALSHTLATYPLLAGRLVREPGLSALAARNACGYHVSLCNAGATFTEVWADLVADADAGVGYGGGCGGTTCAAPLTLEGLASAAALGRSGFSHLRAGAKGAALPPYMEPLDAAAALEGREPLLKVRLTHLPHCRDHLRQQPDAPDRQDHGSSNSAVAGGGGGESTGGGGGGNGGGGGCVLGLSLHHAVVDGHSAAMLVNALAACYSRLRAQELQPDCYSQHQQEQELQPALAGSETAAAPGLAVESEVREGQEQGQGQGPVCEKYTGGRGGLDADGYRHGAALWGGAGVLAGLGQVKQKQGQQGEEREQQQGKAPAGHDYKAVSAAGRGEVAAVAEVVVTAVAGEPVDGAGEAGGTGGVAAAARPQQQKQEKLEQEQLQPNTSAVGLAVGQGQQQARLQHWQQPAFDRTALYGAGQQGGRAGDRKDGKGSSSSSSDISSDISSRDHVRRVLHLQVPPAPGWRGALGHITDVVRLAAAEQRLWPGSWAPPPPRLPAFLRGRNGGGGAGAGGAGSGARLRLGRRQRPRNEGLTCAVLHLDQSCLTHLKTLAAGGRRDVSSNDAVTALVWVLMCGLRGRPLPGAAHPTAAADGVAGRSSSTTGISEHRRVNVKVVTQQAAPPTGGCLAMAVDLRRNFLSGTLPYSYFGMASWCLHVTGADPLGAAPASGTDGAAAAARGPQHQGQQQELYSAAVSSGPRLRADGRTASTSTLGCKREEEEGQGQQRGGGCGGAGSEAALVAALRHGAGRIRDTLTALRRGPMGAAGAAGQREGGGGAGAGGRDGGDRDGGVAGGDVAVGAALLDLIGEQLSAPASSQAALLARLCVAQDAMVTSWGQFPYWDADFGPEAGSPLRYLCVVHPSPPWMAALMSARPDEGGGVHVLVNVPASALTGLREAPALRLLAPGHALVWP